jgi:hypothetical protein
MQDVPLSSQRRIRVGTKLVGHVVEVKRQESTELLATTTSSNEDPAVNSSSAASRRFRGVQLRPDYFDADSGFHAFVLWAYCELE